jgi:hypothetical protein
MIVNIVCPFCEKKHPIPTDFNCVYTCNCGASYKICSDNPLGTDISTIARDVCDHEFSPFPGQDVEICQVVVNRDFEQLLSLKQSMDDWSQVRFCKYDPAMELALVWLKRP